MKTIPTLAVAALALGLVAAKAHTPGSHAHLANAVHVHDVIGASTPMPDFFGSILTTR